MQINSFSNNIMQLRYSWDKANGEKETWEDIARRVTDNVMSAVSVSTGDREAIYHMIAERKFIPGGRFLAQAGREYHQTNNCLGGETKFITRDGLRTLEQCAGTEVTLLTSNGYWAKAEIVNFGEQKLYELVVSRAGTVKSIFTTTDHRWFVSKGQGENDRSLGKQEKLTRDLVAGDRLYQVFGYGISRNTPSLAGIQHGLVFGDGTRVSDSNNFSSASIQLCGEKDNTLLKYFLGYDTKENQEGVKVSGLPRLYKEGPSMLNDRNYLYGWLAGYFAADGCVSKEGNIILNSTNKENLETARDICHLLGIGVNSINEQDRISNLTGDPSTLYSLTFMRETLVADFFLIEKHKERFLNNPSKRRSHWRVVAVNETDRFENVYCAVVPETHEFVLEDNILTGNCFMLRAEDTRAGWGDLLSKATRALMSGGGIGVDYSDLRPNGAPLKTSGGTSSGPLPLMKVVNEVGRGVMAGGKRRSAIWAGLRWSHPDIMEFIKVKNWIPEVRKLKEKDYDFPASLDMTNISVILDKDFFDAYELGDGWARELYWAVIERMLKTGEPKMN